MVQFRIIQLKMFEGESKNYIHVLNINKRNIHQKTKSDIKFQYIKYSAYKLQKRKEGSLAL